MLVLVSREAAKGDRTGELTKDFHHTTEGEILTVPAIVCEGDPRYAARCGCDRAFSGLESGTSCTVGSVEEMDEAEARSRFERGKQWDAWGPDMNGALWDDFLLLCRSLDEDGCAVGDLVRIKSTPETFRLASAPEGVLS